MQICRQQALFFLGFKAKSCRSDDEAEKLITTPHATSLQCCLIKRRTTAYLSLLHLGAGFVSSTDRLGSKFREDEKLLLRREEAHRKAQHCRCPACDDIVPNTARVEGACVEQLAASLQLSSALSKRYNWHSTTESTPWIPIELYFSSSQRPHLAQGIAGSAGQDVKVETLLRQRR